MLNKSKLLSNKCTVNDTQNLILQKYNYLIDYLDTLLRKS